MSQPVTETEATQHLSEYLDRVVRNGESFVIVRGNTTIAELHPVPLANKLPRSGTIADLKAIIEAMSQFTPEETEEYTRHVEEGQAMMNQVEDVNRWEP